VEEVVAQVENDCLVMVCGTEDVSILLTIEMQYTTLAAHSRGVLTLEAWLKREAHEFIEISRLNS
jgi:hypothetical protein